MNHDEKDKCPDCGTDKAEWDCFQVNQGPDQDGHLRLKDVRTLFYLVCCGCGKKLQMLSGDDVAKRMTLRRNDSKARFVVRPAAYFTSDDFDCTRQSLLDQVAERAEHWFKRVDGSYQLPHVGGQPEQILEMAIAAQLKQS